MTTFLAKSTTSPNKPLETKSIGCSASLGSWVDISSAVDFNNAISSFTILDSGPNLFVASAIISSASPNRPLSNSICFGNADSLTSTLKSPIAFSVSFILSI